MLANNIPSFKHRDWLTDILCLAFILLVFYSAWLGSYPLFTPDEGRYSEAAWEMVATGDYITPRVNGVAFLDKPILYYWLQATAITLFGIKEWALRFFPMLLGILGCIIVYICGRHLFDRRTGFISALILATTPLYFGGAHYANLDLEVAVFISSSLLFFITAIQGPEKFRTSFLLAAYVAAAFAFLTKGLIGIVFPTLIIGCWILLLKRFRLLLNMRLITGLAIFIAIITPWYALAQKANPAFLNYFFITQQVSRFVSTQDFNNQSHLWFYLPIILAGFFPWSILLFQAGRKALCAVWHQRETHPTELFLLLWAIIIFAFFSIPSSKIVGYILPVLPPLALLVGHYLSSNWQQIQKKSLQLLSVGYAACCLLVSGLLLAVPHYNWINTTPGISPYLIAMAVILSVSALFSLLIMKKDKLSLFFLICAISSTFSLLTITSGARYLNQNSTKPLVTYLKTVIQPEDEVITYFKYYYDVPLYLGQRVAITADWESSDLLNRDNWRREMWLGKSFQNTDATLINENQFWQRWNGEKRVFVFLNTNYFDRFKERATSYFHLGRNNDILLLSNQPTVLDEHP